MRPTALAAGRDSWNTAWNATAGIQPGMRRSRHQLSMSCPCTTVLVIMTGQVLQHHNGRVGEYALQADVHSNSGGAVYKQQGGANFLFFWAPSSPSRWWLIGTSWDPLAYGIESSADDAVACPTAASGWQHYDGSTTVPTTDLSVTCPSPPSCPCDVITISTSAGALSSQPTRAGTYVKVTGTILQGRFLYQQQDGSNYLFFAPREADWLVGSDPSSLAYGLRSGDDSNAACPTDANDWRYFDGTSDIVGGVSLTCALSPPSPPPPSPPPPSPPPPSPPPPSPPPPSKPPLSPPLPLLSLAPPSMPAPLSQPTLPAPLLSAPGPPLVPSSLPLPPSQPAAPAMIIGGLVATLGFLCVVGAACHRVVANAVCRGTPGSSKLSEDVAARMGDQVLPYKANLPCASSAAQKSATDDPAEDAPAMNPATLVVEELC